MAPQTAKKQIAATDPLEAAKIASKPAPPPPSPPGPPPLLHMPTGEIEPEKPACKRYRVVTATTVSLGGQLVKLHAGDVVSESDYGPKGMALILGANVALAELE